MFERTLHVTSRRANLLEDTESISEVCVTEHRQPLTSISGRHLSEQYLTGDQLVDHLSHAEFLPAQFIVHADCTTGVQLNTVLHERMLSPTLKAGGEDVVLTLVFPYRHLQADAFDVVVFLRCERGRIVNYRTLATTVSANDDLIQVGWLIVKPRDVVQRQSDTAFH